MPTVKSLEFLLFRFSKFVRIEIRLITQVGWVVKLLLCPPFLLDDYKTRLRQFWRSLLFFMMLLRLCSYSAGERAALLRST